MWIAFWIFIVLMFGSLFVAIGGGPEKVLEDLWISLPLPAQLLISIEYSLSPLVLLISLWYSIVDLWYSIVDLWYSLTPAQWH